MSSPERLNVLISRARNGLILIGNSSTFEQSRKGGELWTKFLNLVRNGGYMFKGLPVRCQRHPNWTREMQQPDEFSTYSPDGGCTESWFVSVFVRELFLTDFCSAACNLNVNIRAISSAIRFAPPLTSLMCTKQCYAKFHLVRRARRVPIS